MKRSRLLLIPAAAVVLTLLIGGIYLAQASSAADFNTVNGTLYSYTGSDASVVVPGGVKKIAENAFRQNIALEQITLPSTLESIGANAFEGCSSLRAVVIPDSVEEVGDAAFMGCSSLSQVSIGSGVRVLGNGVFGDCDTLQAISVSSANPNLITNGHALYSAGMSKLYQYCAGSRSGAYTLPGSVTEICPNSFWGCDELKVVTIPGIAEISDYAFTNCRGLVSVTMQIPTNRIGMKAFSGCDNLVQAVIPDSVREIHETAFDGCPIDLHLVCAPSSKAFSYADAKGYLTSEQPVITIHIEEDEIAAQTAGQSTETAAGTQQEQSASASAAAGDPAQQSPVAQTAPAEAHDGLRITYDGVTLGNAPVVSDRAYVIVDNFNVVDASVTAAPPRTEAAPTPVPSQAADDRFISDHAHYLDLTLTDFRFPDTLQMIGDFAFARSGILKAELPKGVTHIGEGAFYHCDQLADVTIPSTVTSVGKNAFTYTPWYTAWEKDSAASDFLIVGDGVLIGYKGTEETPALPAGVKHVADGVFE